MEKDTVGLSSVEYNTTVKVNASQLEPASCSNLTDAKLAGKSVWILNNVYIENFFDFVVVFGLVWF